MKVIKRYCLFFFFSFTLIKSAFTQRYNFHNYNVSNGLSGSTVNAILQDANGNLLIGTSKGYNEFDGTEFRNFSREFGLMGVSVTNLLLDKKRQLWIGTEKGLFTISGKKVIKLTSNQGVPSINITGMSQHPDQSLWVSSNSGIVIISRDQTGQHEIKIPQTDFLKQAFKSIYIDKQSNVWLSSQNGSLYCLVPGNISVLNNVLQAKYFVKEVNILNKKYKLLEIKLNDCNECVIKNIIQDSFKNIWISVSNKGIYKINFNDFENGVNKIDFLGKESVGDNFCINVNTIYEDNHHNIWLGSDGSGAYKFKYNPDYKEVKLKVENLFHYSTNQGLQGDHIHAIFQDKEDNMWFGTKYSGLSMLGDESFTNFVTESGLSEVNILAITQNIDGKIWIGTHGGGIYRLDNNRFTPFFFKDKNKEIVITDITHDQKGNIWLATENEGMFFLERNNQQNTDASLTQILTTKEGLSSNQIQKIYFDNQGALWAGHFQKGIDIVYLNNYVQDKAIVKHLSTSDGLSSDKITDIIQDAKGDVWVSTFYGLNQIRPNVNDGLPKIISAIKKTQMLPDPHINCLALDVLGNLWLGSYSGGINIYKINNKLNYFKTAKSDQLWEYIHSSNGINDEQISSICSDDFGNMWVSSHSGLNKIEFSKKGIIKKITDYSKNEGFSALEFHLRSILNDKDGNLWFGSVNGLVKFVSKDELPANDELNLYIKGLKLFLNDIDWDSVSVSKQPKYRNLEKAKFKTSDTFGGLPSELELPYDQNHITIDFVGICLKNPKNIKYRYVLKGLDKTWNPVTNENHVTYSNLPPGTYTFMLNASYKGTDWNQQPVEYTFKVRANFWNSIWFYLSVVIVVILSILLIIRSRTKSLANSRFKLEKQLRLTTTELLINKEESRKHIDTIGIKNKYITDSLSFAKQIQEVLMPDEEIKFHLPDSFVINLPQQIVSGDFCWFSVISDSENSSSLNDEFMLAVADCTGHGVPGALMSMIGVTILNRLVNETGMRNPGEILHHLDEQIKASLKQDRIEVLSRNGMDIALCHIDRKNKKINFSGALRPLYILRNAEIIVLSSSKYPIGGFVLDEVRYFECNSFDLQNGDCVYLFTDGYPDQFGGDEGKKLHIRNFKNLLLEIYNKPMEEQKYLLEEYLIRWRGNYDQTDDILVAGFRVE